MKDGVYAQANFNLFRLIKIQGHGKKNQLVNKMGVWCLLVGGNIHGDGGVGMFYAL